MSTQRLMNNSSIKHPCQCRFCYLKRFIIMIKVSFLGSSSGSSINCLVLECQYLFKIQFISNNCRSKWDYIKEKRGDQSFLGLVVVEEVLSFLSASVDFFRSFLSLFFKAVMWALRMVAYDAWNLWWSLAPTEVEIVFLASVARIRHLYSMDSPAALSFLFCSLDFKDDLFKVTHTEPFSLLFSNMLVSSFRNGSNCSKTIVENLRWILLADPQSTEKETSSSVLDHRGEPKKHNHNANKGQQLEIWCKIDFAYITSQWTKLLIKIQILIEFEANKTVKRKKP